MDPNYQHAYDMNHAVAYSQSPYYIEGKDYSQLVPLGKVSSKKKVLPAKIKPLTVKQKLVSYLISQGEEPSKSRTLHSLVTMYQARYPDFINALVLPTKDMNLLDTESISDFDDSLDVSDIYPEIKIKGKPLLPTVPTYPLFPIPPQPISNTTPQPFPTVSTQPPIYSNFPDHTSRAVGQTYIPTIDVDFSNKEILLKLEEILKRLDLLSHPVERSIVLKLV